MLNPDATNMVTCLTCGWKRLLDSNRSYRGGHKDPATGAECHEMLLYAQLDARAPEVAVLSEDRPKTSVHELSQMAGPLAEEEGDEGLQRLEAAQARNASIDAQLAELYELTGDELDELIERVRGNG